MQQFILVSSAFFNKIWNLNINFENGFIKEIKPVNGEVDNSPYSNPDRGSVTCGGNDIECTVNINKQKCLVKVVRVVFTAHNI